jgi:hypothetical protein
MKKIDFVTKVPVNAETCKVDFSETINVDSVNKDELYSRGREWFARTFVSSKAVLQMDDRTAGKMIGKADAEMPDLGTNCVMYFIVSVYLKDNSYKYSFSDIHYEYDVIGTGIIPTKHYSVAAEDMIVPEKIGGCACIVAKARAKFRDRTIRIIEDAIMSLNKAMSTKSF